MASSVKSGSDPAETGSARARRVVIVAFCAGVIAQLVSVGVEIALPDAEIVPQFLVFGSYIGLAVTLVAFVVFMRAGRVVSASLLSAAGLFILVQIVRFSNGFESLAHIPILGSESAAHTILYEYSEPVAWIFLLVGLLGTSMASFRARTALVQKNALLAERLEMERALRESEDKLQYFLTYIPEMAMTLSLEGVITSANRTWDGSDPGELLGKSILQFIHRSHQDEFQTVFARVSDTRNPESAVFRGAGRDDVWTWFEVRMGVIEADGEVQSLILIARDITEERRLKEALLYVVERTSPATGRAFYKSVVQHLAEALNVEYVLIGEITGESRNRIRTLAVWGGDAHGKDMEYDLAGTPCAEVIRGDVCHYPRNVEELFPEDPVLAELGAESYLGAPIFDSGNRPLGLLVAMDKKPMEETKVAESILKIFALRIGAELERQRTERARLEMELKMQHTQKLESLGVLAGGIAHDFNNLLTAMLGNAGFVKEEITPESSLWESMCEIETAATRAADLTQQMLAYSGKGRFLIESMHLNAVVEEMTHLLRASLSKKAQVEFDLQDDMPCIEGDAAQIGQIMMNLITNASDALHDESGRIGVRTYTIESSDLEDSDTIISSDEYEGIYAVLEVSDTGCGMDEEIRSKMLEPFFTTKFAGRGLGLAAVSGIVRGHKGAMSVESAPGSGTTIRVMLPTTDEPSKAKGNGHDDLSGSHTTDKAILLVDDEVMVRNLSRKVLEKSGYRVFEAADGMEAIRLFGDHHADISLVILDLAMPLMDGEETFNELRVIEPSVPVILSSGYAEQKARERFAENDLCGFIQKPFHASELLREVEAATNRGLDPVASADRDDRDLS